MSVYVDGPLNMAGPDAPRCFQAGHCHMYADTLAELHKFATRIGLKRAWFQNHPHLHHYDLTLGKREKAIKLGAIAHNRQQAVDKWDELRKKRYDSNRTEVEER